MPRAIEKRIKALKYRRRQRQLAKIDAQLAEFGIEAPAPKVEEPRYQMIILGEHDGEKRRAAT